MPTRPSIEEMLMMDPVRCSRMTSATAAVPKYAPLMLTSIIRRCLVEREFVDRSRCADASVVDQNVEATPAAFT